jgi:Serine dehydrogenase proteinase
LPKSAALTSVIAAIGLGLIALARSTGPALLGEGEQLAQRITNTVAEFTTKETAHCGSLDRKTPSKVPAPPHDVPIDIVLHTPGGLVLAALQIARATLWGVSGESRKSRD